MPAGTESFRRAMCEDLRNLHIVALIEPLITFRQELIGDDEFANRAGTDDQVKVHLMGHLVNCDRMRRRVTHNPENEDLGTLIEKATDVNNTIDSGEKPFGGDDIQNQSGGLFDLPYALDGSDPDIPPVSKIRFANGKGMLILGALDRAIVNITRMNSRDRTRFITKKDSMRLFGNYQEIQACIRDFLGVENQVDIAQVLPSQEPLGPSDSPNIKGEAANQT